MHKASSSRIYVGCAVLFGSVAMTSTAFAATYQVGPDKAYPNLGAVVGMLKPGETLEVSGDQTYPGGVIFDQPGEGAAKITIRGIRVNGKRPVFSGGTNTIEARANHYVFEGLDVTGGTSRCFYHHADDIVLRDSIVHDCPKHGILGADAGSGSLLLEYTEVHHCGNETFNHQVYMSTNENDHPGSVFRMQHCYVHDGNGGNGVKSRAERNEIYYNWLEGAMYHEAELIGPDPSGGVGENVAREDSDVVGNVFLKRNTFAVVRFGGDGTGQTNGRYRFVNNTVITFPNAQAVFRLYDGIESLEAHNNAFFAIDGGTVNMVREAEANWTTGKSVIVGSNNWVVNGSTNVPSTWTNTILGADPGFSNLGADDVRLDMKSPLIDAGATMLSGPPAQPFPNPLAVPLAQPPLHAIEANGAASSRPVVGKIDIGAYEFGFGGSGGSGGASGGGGSAGNAGAGGTGGSAGSGVGGESSGNGGSGGSNGSGGKGGAGSGGNDPGEASGCACRMAPVTSARYAWLLALAPLGAIARKRRKRNSC